MGCGIGLTGLVICCTCSPCRYIFSDYHEEVLEALQCNLGLNGFTSSLELNQTEESALSCTVRENDVDSETNYKHLEETPVRNTSASTIHLTSESQDHKDCSGKIPEAAFHLSSEMTYSMTQVESESDLQKCNGILGCMACVSHFSESGANTYNNQSSRAANCMAHFSRQSANIWRHLDKDCGKHSGSVQADVCKLEWKTLKKSDLEKFSVGIILAAGTLYGL